MMDARFPASGPRAVGGALVCGATLALLVAVPACRPRSSGSSSASSSGSSASPARQESIGLTPTLLLSGTDSAGFAQATGPVPFSFPGDHGPHPAFRTEWWYFTGILQERTAPGGATNDGPPGGGRPRRFGYQFTVFRQALASETPARDSAWATRDSYMAHLTVSDIDGRDGESDDAGGRRFHAFQRFAREGLGLAGARAALGQHPFEVWVESWRMNGGVDFFPLALRARQDQPASAPSAGIGIDLSVAAGRGPILQGDRGWSVKGAAAGNASYYYSCTRLPTQGRLTLGQQTFDVSGTSWLDREWSTSALDHQVVGWDWLGVHLDDGRDLMVYRLRRGDGAAAAASRATLIHADGSTRVFAADAFSLTAQGTWQSADRQARYPAAFLLTIPPAGLQLTITPLLADQELVLAVRYWEGAVIVSGKQIPGDRTLGGSGYLELTGYAETTPLPAPPSVGGDLKRR